MRVALFITCFNDTLFPETGQAVVRLLERLGHEVEFPMEQTCCGQMHFNTGYRREAIPLVRRFVERVRAAPRRSSRPSASCVGMVREHVRRELGDRRARRPPRASSSPSSSSTGSASRTSARTTRTA